MQFANCLWLLTRTMTWWYAVFDQATTTTGPFGRLSRWTVHITYFYEGKKRVKKETSSNQCSGASISLFRPWFTKNLPIQFSLTNWDIAASVRQSICKHGHSWNNVKHNVGTNGKTMPEFWNAQMDAMDHLSSAVHIYIYTYQAFSSPRREVA